MKNVLQRQKATLLNPTSPAKPSFLNILPSDKQTTITKTAETNNIIISEKISIENNTSLSLKVVNQSNQENQPTDFKLLVQKTEETIEKTTPLVHRSNKLSLTSPITVTSTSTVFSSLNSTANDIISPAVSTYESNFSASLDTSTITTYSHNSKTTRSWPVIYRNPHQHDYEALYVQSKPKKSIYYTRPPTVSFKQNCYSTQFTQSIIYSSSNEDLTPLNECITNVVGANGSGTSNSNNYTQTTCYYFTPSRHNSIYDHSSIIGSTIHLDKSNASSAVAAVENLRRNNSLLLQNNNFSKVLGGNGGGKKTIGTPISFTSAMELGTSTVSTGCSLNCCIGPPPMLFLFVTLLMTASATAMLCAAIMTDHWEHVTWDRSSLDKYSNNSGFQLEWILNEKVAILKPDRKNYRFRRDFVFLVPMHGGIWTLCINLPLVDLYELRRNPKFPRSAPPCVNYLAGSMENARGEEQRNDWQHSESQTTLQPHLRTYGTTYVNFSLFSIFFFCVVLNSYLF